MATQEELRALWDTAAPAVQESQEDLMKLWEQAEPVATEPVATEQPGVAPDQPQIETAKQQRGSLISDTLDQLGQFGEGMRRAGEGFTQTALQVGEMMGFDMPVSSKMFTAATEQRRREAPAPETAGGTVARVVGEMAPGMVAPVVRGGVMLAGASNATINAMLSAAAFTPQGESKIEQAMMGGALGMAPEAATGAVKTMLTGKPSSKKLVEVFDEVGTTPSVGQATGNETLQSMENVMGKNLGGIGISSDAAANAQLKLGQATEKAADKLAGQMTDEMSGQVVRQGIHKFTDNFKARTELLYRRLNDAVPEAKAVDVSNALKTIDDLTRAVPGAENVSEALTSSHLKNLSNAFSSDAVDGTLPFGALQEFRSAIGRKLSSPELVSDYSKAELKQIYGALSDDIRNAAEGAGAGDAFKRANNYYKAGLDRIDKYMQPLAKKVNDIDIYRDLTTAAGKGGQKLNKIKKSLTKKQWESFVGTKVRELGILTPGLQGADGLSWSSNKFLTDWNRLHPSAKKVMFSGTKELEQYGRDLDKIALASDAIKDAATSMANSSGTAAAATTTAILGGGIGGAVGLATGTGGAALAGIAGLIALNNLGSRILHNPKIVRKIASMPEKAQAGWLSSKIGRGTALYSAQDDDTKNEIDGLITAYEQRQ